jgi:Abnormal spindle-like microcephaly-assoc'd, ASPM-SPD-2-Hydin
MLPAERSIFSLSGVGAPPGVVSLAPTTIDFGQVKVGSTSAPLQITAENSGGTPVAITSVTVSGPFVLASNLCGTTTLAANADCQLTVEFQPTASGPATGAVTFVDAAGTQSVQLTGTGAAPPTDTLSATSLTFPGTFIGQSPAPQQTITLTNSGDLPLESINGSVSGPVSGQFQTSNDCTTQLAAHRSCTLTVSFTPTQTGTLTGTLTISDSVSKAQTVSLTGAGVPPPAFSVDQNPLTFAGQPVGVASKPATLTITNSGGAAMATVSFEITVQSSGTFSTGATTCGATLAAGASCTVQVVFTPAASGGAAAILTISSSTTGVKPLPVQLNGTGLTSAGLGVNPAQLSFGAQEIGQSSAAQTVTISDTGGTSANGFALTITGPFSLSQNNCGASLAAGASCTTGVLFTPTSRGPLTGTLTASSSSLSTPATVALSGIGGLTGAVALTPALVNFPITGVGATSSPVTVTISNSSAAVALGDLKLSASAGFKVAAITCGNSLAPGSSCTAGVSFAPTNPGAQSGTLTLTSSGLAASASVPLSGMGFDFQATPSGASSQTVASGQTASFSVKLAPSSGAAATFSFQCGTLPAYAACSFNPASANVPADTTGTEAIQVTTSQATSALVRPPSRDGWLGLPVAFALLVLPFAARRRKGFFLFLASAFLVIGFDGCSSSGGGGGGTPPPPATHTTPAGTYSIPVTVTSNGVQHTVTLTLVVD